MVDILFGESEAACMRYAKTVRTLPAGEGGPDTVLCLAFMLDIGDIQKAIDSSYRQELIFSMYSQDQDGHDEAACQELKEAGPSYVRQLARLEEYLKQGQAVRIWCSHSPYSLCGLCFLCDWMKSYKNPVSAVELPRYRTNGSRIVSCQSWGEVSHNEFQDFLPLERPLSSLEREMYALLWTDLQRENAPLRAIINGKLLSVPEDFYDFLIWRELTDKPVKQALLIGNILGKYPVGTCDWWYARRIDTFIKQGKIKVTEDSGRKYARTIRRV